MENEKKKKRNRNKKNKQQNKVAEGVAVNGGGSISIDQNHVIENGQNTSGQVSETTDAEVDVLQKMERHLPSDSKGPAEAEEEYWLENKACLEQKIAELQKEKDVYKEKEAILEAQNEQLLKEKDKILQKEAILEENLQTLKDENHAYENKEAILEEKLVQLQKGREAHMQKEASLEEKVRNMHKEKEFYMQKEAELESTIMQLQSEKDSWPKKESSFGEKIDQLVDEAATLSLKVVSLEEKIKQMERERDSWVQKENSCGEIIASLDSDNKKLSAEVKELEVLRNNLLQENQLLKENIFSLQSHITNLKQNSIPFPSTEGQTGTSTSGHVNSELDAARSLVEKLVAENAELIEKVNELYVELARRGPTVVLSPSTNSHPEPTSAESAHVGDSSLPATKRIVEVAERDGSRRDTEPLESRQMTPFSGENMQSMEEMAIKHEIVRDYMNAKNTNVHQDCSEITESDEIVQIPLDENEIQVANSDLAHDEEKTDVPLADAPLIGAPFRLISFVARYVSGADLVNKNALNSGG